MRNRNCAFLLILLLFFILTILVNNYVQGEEKKGQERLAVLDLDAKYGIEKDLAKALSVIVRDKIHSFGEFQVMSREDIEAVANREQLMQAMGCDDGSGQCLVNFGRAIGTRYMVAGDISKLGSTYTVSLRMLDTKGENAGVSNRVSGDYKCDEDGLIEAVRNVAMKLVGKSDGAALKKAENKSKQLAEEKKKSAEFEQLRLVEEKRKEQEVERQRLAKIVEERRKAEDDKQKLFAEIENLKREKEKSKVEANQTHLDVEEQYIINKMEKFDKQHLNETFELKRSGSNTEWRNQSNDTSYEVIPQPAFYNPSHPETPCRKAEIIAITDSRTERTYATACRNSAGQWVLQN